MATARTLPTPPSRAPSLGYTPSSPTKRDPALKPNPHPYAIRTTSTALLSRSNSSGHNVNATHHYYIPLSPSHNRTSEHKGHRLSKSLNSTSESPRSAPRPLPVPPSFQSHTRAGNGPVPDNGRGGYVSADETCAPSRHSRRAETLPLIPLFDTTPHPTATLEDLPSNPKLWTPSQLSSYLVTALRVTLHTHSGEDDQVALPFPIAKDIAAFVKDARIGGRMFLRLNEEDLEGMGMTKRWREALLAASRNLRQNVLKGRIWGPDAANSHSPDSGSPPRPSRIFANAQYNSSSSSIESFTSDGEDADKFHHAKASRNGRVRGMVATFERSGSFSSESGFDGDQERTTAGRWLREKRSMEEDAIRSPSPTDRRPLPTPPISTGVMIGMEEPSMEALLAASESPHIPTAASWGARAWEAMDLAPGVTVKHIGETTLDGDSLEGSMTVLGPGCRRGSGKGSGARGRGDRRVVTAIFTPTSDAAESILQAPLRDQEATVQTLEKAAKIDADAQTMDPEDTREQGLEAELAATRTLVDSFRRRLEVVEQKVAELERRENDPEREADKFTSGTEKEGWCPAQEDLSATQGDKGVSPAATSSSLGSSLLSLPSTLLPTTLQGLNFPSGIFSTTSDPDDEPASISDLPSYVFLVGLGVCAVVVRVMLRKVAGRGSGWRP